MTSNKFFVRPKTNKVITDAGKGFESVEGTAGVTRKPNQNILEHDRKSQIQLKLLVLEEKLIDQGYTDAEISEKLEEAKKSLEDGSNAVASSENARRKEDFLSILFSNGAMKGKEAKGGPSSSDGDSEEPKMDIKSILKDMEFLETSHMTWKQKKDLQNRKVVSLGGKPPKKQRLPLSVARVTMKKQKEREEKMLQERAILGRFGAFSSSSGTKRVAERRKPEDRVLKSIEGHFRNGVLDVKHMLQSSAPQASKDNGRYKEKKTKGGGKKGNGKRKGGGKKRH